MVFNSNRVTIEKAEDGKYKIIAGLDIYDDEESILPNPDNAKTIIFTTPLSDEQVKTFTEYKTFTFDIGYGEVEISYKDKIKEE